MQDLQLCPLCKQTGINSRLQNYQINLDEAIVLCQNKECTYLLDNEGRDVTFSRSFKEMPSGCCSEIPHKVPDAQLALQTKAASNMKLFNFRNQVEAKGLQTGSPQLKKKSFPPLSLGGNQSSDFLYCTKRQSPARKHTELVNYIHGNNGHNDQECESSDFLQQMCQIYGDVTDEPKCTSANSNFLNVFNRSVLDKGSSLDSSIDSLSSMSSCSSNSSVDSATSSTRLGRKHSPLKFPNSMPFTSSLHTHSVIPSCMQSAGVVAVTQLADILGAQFLATAGKQSSINNSETQSTNMLVTQSSIPGTQSTFCLGTHILSVSEMQSASIPGAQPASIPGTQSTSIPGTQPTNIPGTQSTSIPGTQSTIIPGTHPASFPVPQLASIPGTLSRSIPGTQPASIPGTQSASIPGTQSASIPGTQSASIPGTPSASIPGTLSASNFSVTHSTDITGIQTGTSFLQVACTSITHLINTSRTQSINLLDIPSSFVENNTNKLPILKSISTNVGLINSSCVPAQHDLTDINIQRTVLAENDGTKLLRDVTNSDSKIKDKIDSVVDGSVVENTFLTSTDMEIQNVPICSSGVQSNSVKTHVESQELLKCPSIFPQWKNEDSLCWLDVILCLAVHNETLKAVVLNESFDKTSLIYKLFMAHKQACAILNKVLCESKVVSEVNAQNVKPDNDLDITECNQNINVKAVNAGHSLRSRFNEKNDSRSDKLKTIEFKPGNNKFNYDSAETCGSDLSKVAIVDAILNSVRDEIWERMKSRLKCKRGDKESPLFAFPILLQEQERVAQLFTMQYSFEYKCTRCHFKEQTEHEKILPTFPAVVNKFNIGDPQHKKKCPVCFYSRDKRIMVYKKLPECLLMHFTDGLPSIPWDELQFGFHTNVYVVTGVIQYINNPDHFVAWLRNPIANRWMKCNDLGKTVCKYTVGSPKFPSKQRHIIMWERMGSKLPLSAEISVTVPCEQLPKCSVLGISANNVCGRKDGPKTRETDGEKFDPRPSSFMTCIPSIGMETVVMATEGLNKHTGTIINNGCDSSDKQSETSGIESVDTLKNALSKALAIYYTYKQPNQTADQPQIKNLQRSNFNKDQDICVKNGSSQLAITQHANTSTKLVYTKLDEIRLKDISPCSSMSSESSDSVMLPQFTTLASNCLVKPVPHKTVTVNGTLDQLTALVAASNDSYTGKPNVHLVNESKGIKCGQMEGIHLKGTSSHSADNTTLTFDENHRGNLQNHVENNDGLHQNFGKQKEVKMSKLCGQVGVIQPSTVFAVPKKVSDFIGIELSKNPKTGTNLVVHENGSCNQESLRQVNGWSHSDRKSVSQKVLDKKPAMDFNKFVKPAQSVSVNKHSWKNATEKKINEKKDIDKSRPDSICSSKLGNFELPTILRKMRFSSTASLSKDAFRILDDCHNSPKLSGSSAPVSPADSLSLVGNVTYLSSVKQYLLSKATGKTESRSRFQGLHLKSTSKGGKESADLDGLNFSSNITSITSASLTSSDIESPDVFDITDRNHQHLGSNFKLKRKRCDSNLGFPSKMPRNNPVSNGGKDMKLIRLCAERNADNNSFSIKNKNNIDIDCAMQSPSKEKYESEDVLQDLYDALNIPFNSVKETMSDIMTDVDDILDMVDMADIVTGQQRVDTTLSNSSVYMLGNQVGDHWLQGSCVCIAVSDRKHL